MTSIIVHGGAGVFRREHIEAAKRGCLAAANHGRGMLLDGVSALDAVEQVVNLLENDPTFDAGTGSYLNSAGGVQMDAIIVDGTSLKFGSVAGIENVAHPVSVARRLLDDTPHHLIVGEGATRFAHESGFPFVRTAELAGEAVSGPDHGTVGAVALDCDGHIAAATSTGGTRDKLPGRVGDSALIGCGAIAEDGVGGMSATGHGESLMRIQMARTTLDYQRHGLTARQAAKAAVRHLEDKTHGIGGVICVDAQGRCGFAFNTSHLAVAWSALAEDARTSI